MPARPALDNLQGDANSVCLKIDAYRSKSTAECCTFSVSKPPESIDLTLMEAATLKVQYFAFTTLRYQQ